ncbi:MAG: hypothetical protein K2K81_03800 [Muribaculaceae bacterium]|nr:hypothetical protein [Muribaculaceae bacterium]
MANYFIFGIGGTGSRVIRSFTMLLAAGVTPFKSSDKIFPILIDYDTTNGDTKRTKDIMAEYHSIHKSAYPQGLRDEEKFSGLFFSTPILEMQEVSPACKSTFAMEFGEESEQTFEQWTAANQLRYEKERTADLMNSLYDDSGDDNNAELKLKMDKGFKGNPNIGSIVFHSLKNTTEFSDFTTLCQKGDKVIIIGSLFGGTGSSGIPELVQAIRTNNKTEVKNIDLSVVMVCPYFAFRSKDEKAVRSSIFKSKTKAALNFYDLSGINKMINSIYYVGDDRPSTFEYSEGGETQKNATHIVDLVSALSICHFAERNTTEDNSTKYFKYRIKEEGLEFIDSDEEDENQNGLNFTNFMESELSRVIYPLASFALAMRFFHDEVAQGSKIVKELDWYKTLELSKCFKDGRAVIDDTNNKNKEMKDLCCCCDGWMNFYDLFTIWNEEFKSHSSHGLFLFNFNREKSLADFIIAGDLKSEKSVFGIKKTEEHLEMETDVAEGTKNVWTQLKAVSTFSLDSKYKAFMLMAVLTGGCREVFMSDKGRAAERNRMLTSKSLKVVTAEATT